jgi:hypothetical protein
VGGGPEFPSILIILIVEITLSLAVVSGIYRTPIFGAEVGTAAVR